MSDRVRGTDQAPQYRAKMAAFRSCEWDDHHFSRYVHMSIGGGETMFVLCDKCGRTPMEALGELPVRMLPAKEAESE